MTQHHILLLTLLLLSLSVSADPRELAGQQPSSCSAVISIELPAQELVTQIRPGGLAHLAAQAGLEGAGLGAQLDGRLTLSLYNGTLVWGLGLKDGFAPELSSTGVRLVSGRLLLGPEEALELYLGEAKSLREDPVFESVTASWRGGTVLLYVGDLTRPGVGMQRFFEEYPDTEIEMILSRRPQLPRLCAGLSDGFLEVWTSPLASGALAEERWSRRAESGWQSSSKALATLPGEVAAITNWSNEWIECMLGLNLALPLEWKIYLATFRAFTSGLPVSLAESAAEVFAGRAALGEPFYEVMTHQRDGLWLYRLDRASTARLLQRLEMAWDKEAAIAPQRAEQDQKTSCTSNLKNLGTALEMYSTDHGSYPESLAPLKPDYLRELPRCPTSAHRPGYKKTSAGFQLHCPEHELTYDADLGIL